LRRQKRFIEEDFEEVIAKKKKYIGDESDANFIERAYMLTALFLEL
jgi:hypothetical protein